MRYITTGLLSLCILAGCSRMYAQNIATFAGTGTLGYSGDGGPATAARINMAGSIATDAAGSLYIADRNNARIRKVTGGVISTIAGTGAAGYSGDGGPATSANIYNPSDMVIDAAGNLYFADYGANVVRKINAAGIISTIAGTTVAGYNGDGIAATAAQLNNPIGVAIDAAGNVYVGDFANDRIRKISTSGIITTVAGTGVRGYTADGVPATTAQLHYPNYIHIDAAGNLLISDNGNHRIRQVNAAGIISTVVGNGIGSYVADGVPATATGIVYPGGLTTDAAGNLYFAENGDERVRKVDVSGIISTIAGSGVTGYSGDGGPATAARVNNTTDVAVDGTGNIFLTDVNNGRIRFIAAPGRSPYFVQGHMQSLTVCENSAGLNIDTMLAVIDSDAGQTETWSLYTAPAHGTAIVSYSALSTGGMVVPTGLTYTPMPGYSGADMIGVIINDGLLSDTTTINIVIDQLPDAGIISGIDSVCPGATRSLTETVAGGIWSSSDYTITKASHTGIVTGLIPGKDTIIYTIVNSCGIASAIFPFTVRSYKACHTGVNTVEAAADEGLSIYPNPANGAFTINLNTPDEEIATLFIIDVLGKKVKELTITANKPETINAGLPSGVYLMNAVSSHQQWSKRLVISGIK